MYTSEITYANLRESLGLRYYDVPGDGSCWIYAFLIAASLEPHPIQCTKRTQSLEDVTRIQVCTTMTVLANAWNSKEDPTARERRLTEMKRSPKYVPDGVNGFKLTVGGAGKEGGEHEIACLCWLYDVDCIIWTLTKQDKSMAKFSVHTFKYVFLYITHPPTYQPLRRYTFVGHLR